MRLFAVWIFLLSTLSLPAQDNIGMPEIHNFSKTEYRAGLQNWGFAIYVNDILLVANNEGLLTYNGLDWELFPLPAKTIARSVCVVDEKIYVGGQDEFGYFAPDANGLLQFHDLKALLNPASGFGDVWQIIHWNNKLLLRTNKYVFVLEDGRSQTYGTSATWHYLGISGNTPVAQDSERGLLNFANGQFTSRPWGEHFPREVIISQILEGGNGTGLVFTRRHGILSREENFTPIATNADWKDEQIYYVQRIDSNNIAVGTTSSGVKIIDNSGRIREQYSLSTGLRNENILSIIADKNGSIWLGLDNGIAFIGRNNALKIIDPAGNGNSGYAATVFGGQLYVGTSNGLFVTPLGPPADLSFNNSPFQQVAHSAGQVWSLKALGGKLYMGHHEGAFLVENSAAKILYPHEGYWNFQPDRRQPGNILSGTYDGLLSLPPDGNPVPIAPAFTESSRFVQQDSSGNIWVSHPYHGVFRIGGTDRNSTVEGPYGVKNGLPSNSNNIVYFLKNEVLAATDSGIYRFQAENNRFEKAQAFLQQPGNKSVRFLYDDGLGRLWFVHEKSLSYLQMQGDSVVVADIPEIRNRLLSGFEYVYAYDRENIFISGENGIFHLNAEKYKQVPASAMRVYIHKVVMHGQRDSLIYGGFLKGALEQQPVLPSRQRNIRFQFSESQHAFFSPAEYSLRLVNFENDWSEWSAKTDKEYTNLPGGHYVFEVKMRRQPGQESPVTRFEFQVRPPWYLTLAAKIAYLLIIASLMYAIYLRQRRKLRQQIARHEEEQKQLKYIHDLERDQAEKTVMELHNKNLENELRFKNSQLASNAMHLVQKGELMARLKANLEHLYKDMQNAQAKKEVKTLIKSLHADESFEEDWEQFSQHFDTVHTDLLANLKAQFPQLSANDLKLCAYLRLNLSTKEIARMLNISVRGVEISRYRLRKKLNLETSENLNEFLMGIEDSRRMHVQG